MCVMWGRERGAIRYVSPARATSWCTLPYSPNSGNKDRRAVAAVLTFKLPASCSAGFLHLPSLPQAPGLMKFYSRNIKRRFVRCGHFFLSLCLLYFSLSLSLSLFKLKIRSPHPQSPVAFLLSSLLLALKREPNQSLTPSLSLCDVTLPPSVSPRLASLCTALLALSRRPDGRQTLLSFGAFDTKTRAREK